MRTEWPEVQDVSIRREGYGPDERLLVEAGAWPEYMVIADDVFLNGDPRWVRQSAEYVWFFVHNGFAQYRLIERDDWFSETLCRLEDGIVL